MALSHPGTNGSKNHENRSSPHGTSSVLDLLGPDDPLRKEMEKLLAENNQLMSKMDTSPAPASSAPAPSRPRERREDPFQAKSRGHNDAESLREENARLRARLAELEQMLEATTDQTAEVWAEQQKEYESLLEEKSEIIRHLHQELQGLRQGKPGASASSGGSMPPELAESSLAMRQELTAQKAELEKQRRQLEEDEDALMEQARQMELAMSKERVELARQRNELQQLHRQMQHEIEQATRDDGLRERLMHFQRRSPDAPPEAAPNQPAPRRALPTQQALSPNSDAEEKNTSIFGRLFGK